MTSPNATSDAREEAVQRMRDFQRAEFYSRLPEGELPYCTAIAKETIGAQMKEYRDAAKERPLTAEELIGSANDMDCLWNISDGLESYQQEPATKVFTEAICAHVARNLGLPTDDYRVVAQTVWDNVSFGDAERGDPELEAWLRVKDANTDYVHMFAAPMDYSGLISPHVAVSAPTP